ncbi:MAG: hypothetical protein HN423_08145, partial [Alphaproteobacteria bacterium]|nr:hypothetical protein [Alphaproteobacteria bacterium]
MKKLIAIGSIALISSAPQAWGYTTPIENQTTETINNAIWNLGAEDLHVGSSTFGNAMVVTNGGGVQNFKGFIGNGTGASNNLAEVVGPGSY